MLTALDTASYDSGWSIDVLGDGDAATFDADKLVASFTVRTKRAGVSDLELGLRLRYAETPEFAPYVGVNWSRKLGDTADLARVAGDKPSDTRLVVGLRAWF